VWAFALRCRATFWLLAVGRGTIAGQRCRIAPGGGVADAQITATGSDTGVHYGGDVRAHSGYRIPDVQIGLLYVNDNREGFKTFRAKGVGVQVNSTASLDERSTRAL